MKNEEKYQEIFENTIPHSYFLDKRSIMSCMHQSYQLGQEEILQWLSKMDHLCDNMKYIIDEWNNQHKS